MSRLMFLTVFMTGFLTVVPHSIGGDGTLPVRWVGYLVDNDGNSDGEAEDYLTLNGLDITDKESREFSCSSSQVSEAFMASGSLSFTIDGFDGLGHIVAACESSDSQFLELVIQIDTQTINMTGMLEHIDDEVYFRGQFAGRKFYLRGQL